MTGTPERRSGFAFSFHCQRSGNCCARPGGVVRVDPAEVEAIAAFIGLSPAGFGGRYLAVGGDRLRQGPDQRCVFLEGGREASCAIHPVRPLQCRDWPFWPEMRDPERWRAAMRFCPGITADQPGG